MLEHIEHPFAWLNLEALDHNIQFVNEACDGKPVRIATKSVRSVEALRYIHKHLENCSGYMTFTAAETVYLMEQGLDHFLIGYPVMEEMAVKKLLNYAKVGRNITFMVDSEQHLQFLHKLAKEVNVRVQVCIDVNVSNSYPMLYFGTKRSPLTTINKLEAFLRVVPKYSSIEVTGVMGYDAQIAGLGDHIKGAAGKSFLVRKLKQRSKQSVRSLRQHAVATVKQHVGPLKLVNGGGSGSIQYTASQREVTEITVGSAFFAPALFDGYETLDLQPAAGFALRVVRQFSEDTFVLQGGGYIASGAVGVDRLPSFVESERFSFLALEGAGEVQSPIVDKQAALKIGDTVYLRHAKAGELCERFMALHCYHGMQYEGPWSTYRGDGQCFL